MNSTSRRRHAGVTPGEDERFSKSIKQEKYLEISEYKSVKLQKDETVNVKMPINV